MIFLRRTPRLCYYYRIENVLLHLSRTSIPSHASSTWSSQVVSHPITFETKCLHGKWCFRHVGGSARFKPLSFSLYKFQINFIPKILGDDSEDPAHPKVLWPSAENCPQCRATWLGSQGNYSVIATTHAVKLGTAFGTLSVSNLVDNISRKLFWTNALCLPICIGSGKIKLI